MNFADMIFHHALTRPEKPAIILADRVATYGMMAQGILAVTDRLRELDLTPGSLVSVAIDSPIRHLIVAAALFRLGHPCLPVARTSDLLALELPVALYLEGSSAALVPGLHQVLVEEDWFAAPSRHFDAAPSRAFPSDEAVCYVALSSGTTGRPKAIAFGLDAFCFSVTNYYLSIGQGYWDRMLCLPGLPSNWGFTLAAHALYAGKTLCFADTALDTLHMISVYGADCLVGSTQHLQELVAQQCENPVPCPSLRVVFTGGSLLSRALMTEARGSLCSHIVVQYGSTEAGGTAFAAADRLVETAGATGFVAPWAEVQIVDAEDRMLPPDADGALRIRARCQRPPLSRGHSGG
jgi:acyl-coenzyme A synthetase/AMP-(fatty) acid ligase